MNPITPGIKTTEFWTTMITQIVGLLVLTGHVGANDAPALTQAIISVMTGVTMAVTAITYIWSRYGLKKAQIQSNSETSSQPTAIGTKQYVPPTPNGAMG